MEKVQILVNKMRLYTISMALAFAFVMQAWSVGFLIAQETASLNEGVSSNELLNQTNRDFKGSDGSVIVYGIVWKLEGTTVTIRKPEGGDAEFKLNQFSDNERAFIKKAWATKKKYERGQKDALVIMRNMNTKDVHALIKGCNRLKSLGFAARNIRSVKLLRSLWKNEEPRLKRASFIAHCHVAEPNEKNFKQCLMELNENYVGMRTAFEKHHAELLSGLAVYGEIAFPYIRQVAYTGSLKTKDSEADENVEPVKFEVTTPAQLELRMLAAKTLSKFKNIDSVESLLYLLQTVEKPVNGKVDSKSIEAILTSLGKIGIKNDDVVDALKRHAKNHPDVTKKAMERLKVKK